MRPRVVLRGRSEGKADPIWDEIYMRRKGRGMSLTELASRVGCHANTLSHAECGSADPGLHLTRRVLNELGMTVLVTRRPRGVIW